MTSVCLARHQGDGQGVAELLRPCALTSPPGLSRPASTRTAVRLDRSTAVKQACQGPSEV